MFEVKVKIKADPSSELSYQAIVKIEVEDQGFQEKLLQYSNSRNIRLKCSVKSSFIRILIGKDISVELTEDSKKDSNHGYLEDYILNGFVYGFVREIEAEEFEIEAKNLLNNFISKLELEYLEATKSKYFKS